MNGPTNGTTAAMEIASHDFSIFANSIASFQRPRGKFPEERAHDFFDWQSNRRRQGIWFYSRSLNREPGPATDILADSGRRFSGINFACQNYLGLAGHPRVIEAATDALRSFGPHSAGSPTLLGNTALSLQLEREIGAALHMPQVVLFPTGWAAGFGAIAGLVRPYDHIVMDKLAHACLQQGAHAATKNVYRTQHRSVDSIREHLERIRREDDHNLILVITEGLFSMDADIPDIAAIQQVCRQYDAVLLVDIAHDFGSMGPGGTGALGMQAMAFHTTEQAQQAAAIVAEAVRFAGSIFGKVNGNGHVQEASLAVE